MLNHIKINSPEDFFTELKDRPSRGVYFYRITGCNQKVIDFIKKYYDAALKSGVIIEGKIPNPDNKNLDYYNEVMGSTFSLDKTFISKSIKKWLPRMNDYQSSAVSSAIYDTLLSLRNEGKNDNMLKNTYIKFMCWLYYKFERILSRLGESNVPKILYEGEISNYELLLIRILSGSGCDVVLLQYKGDAAYLKLDAGSRFSDELVLPGTAPFPESFNLKQLRATMAEEKNIQNLYGRMPSVTNCTNAWIKGNGLEDIKTPVSERGNDANLFYNCFYRINGAENKISWVSDLYQFRLGIKNSGRKVVIVDNNIPRPAVDEINGIHKQPNYTVLDRLITDMTSNLSFISDTELKSLVKKSYIDALRDFAKTPQCNLNKVTNRAVYLMCWLKRYYRELFEGWKMPEIACFIYMGGCKDEAEAMFVKILSRLPVDVLILVPDKDQQKCCLNDELLYEITYDDSVKLDKYPTDMSGVRVGTVAYHAEQELDTIMYQDSGMYRNRQYGQANSIILTTMYEEVEQLWGTELKYRPNFSTEGNEVTIPVICAKICGVKDMDLAAYWTGIKRLFTQDTLIINRFPCFSSDAANPISSYVHGFIKDGMLEREKIKSHQCYQYSVLREETQEYILDKLQMLISNKFVKGTFENGTEYSIIASILNLEKRIVHLIQKFDFTKVNPKIVCLSLDEQCMSPEDTAVFTFLSLIGFDIAVFVPTGYQTVEKYFNPGKSIFQEHQEGDYVYDLNAPDFRKVMDRSNKPTWREKFFRRGN